MNRLFQTYKQHIMTGNSLDLTSGDVKVVLIDTNADDPDTGINGDEFYSDISAGAINSPEALANPTVVNGVFDADNHALDDPDGGATGEELVVFFDTGTPSTSRLIAVIDDAGGLPVTLDGVDDLITWAAQGIFAL